MNARMQPQEKRVYRWVTFQVADEVYGINVMQVQEVLRMTEIAPVPGAPSSVIGIINLRGNIVTVVDARELFGLSMREFTEQTRIMIVECKKTTLGLLVDGVAEVVNIDNDHIDAAPSLGSVENSRYIQGVYNINGEILILVDLDKLVDVDGQGVRN